MTNGNPFTPGAGRTPPRLAGREEAIKIFEEVFDLLLASRDEDGCVEHGSFASVRIVAPRGGGRRALLAWVEHEARQRGIRVARCACPDPKDAGGNLHEAMLAAMADEKNGWMGKAACDLLQSWLDTSDIARIKAARAEGRATYRLIQELPKKERLLLIVDDVERYEPESLDDMLFTSQTPISQGYPFALVLAGTPLMDASLARSKAGFIARSEEIYFGALNDKAAREALRIPFEEAGVRITPPALRMLAAQACNYPLFIQLAGAAAWNAMTAAGRKDVDAGLARRSEGQAREGREAFCRSCCERMQAKGLLPYALQVIEWIEGKGGEMDAHALLDALRKANPEVDHHRSYQIRNGLQEEGLIWTPIDVTKPAIPSLFSYLREWDLSDTT